MTTKLRVKYGSLDIEFEGSEEFIKTELRDLLKHIAELPQPSSSKPADSSGMKNIVPKPGQATSGHLSTSVIAQKLGANSGPDLILAACAYLTLGKGMETLPRKAILDEMREAKAYFKTTYRNNLSKYLATLTKSGDLNQLANENYSLPAEKRAEIEARIVG
jgi:hypothetical protein